MADMDRENSLPPIGTQSAPLADVPTLLPPSLELEDPPAFKPGFRVYAIVVGLGIANLLAALENTVVAVAAPVLLTDLRLGDDFVWVTNAFFLCR